MISGQHRLMAIQANLCVPRLGSDRPRHLPSLNPDCTLYGVNDELRYFILPSTSEYILPRGELKSTAFPD